jgi:hypothetical protein
MTQPAPKVLRGDDLVGGLYASMLEALLSACPTYGDLVRLLVYELNCLNTRRVLGEQEQTTVRRAVVSIVCWADSQSRLRDLLVAARCQNPRDVRLKDFCEQIGINS